MEFTPGDSWVRAVSNATHGALDSYKDKLIKLPDLLRRNRTHLQELLLALDGTDGP